MWAQQQDQVPTADTILELRRWFTEGHDSTFHSIRSLQHRATSLAMSTQNEPNMTWKQGSKKTALLFKGGEVSLTGIQACQGALEDKTVSTLTSLLFNHLFHIDLKALKDDMGNTTPGYSMFTDRANASTLGPADALAKHILSTPSLRTQFVVVSNDRIIWNPIALADWLRQYALLDLLCLVQVEMNCGAPGRTTELTGMPCVNTAGGMMRAMRIIDDHVPLMCTYHKMRAAQRQD